MNKTLIVVGLLLLGLSVLFTLAMHFAGALGHVSNGDQTDLLLSAILGSVSAATGYLGTLINKK